MTNLASEEPEIERISIEFPVGHGFHLSDAVVIRHRGATRVPRTVRVEGDRYGKR
jgi:hypothetical protein